ncbi:ABC transporter permease [Corynebacterium sp. HMSC078A10]|uniref:ABC transporter permease n=1 Tax=Corynebacterium sp. HMSC078A10 TaxID=1739312 RepID=UPI0008A5ECDB|nr:FtsX-like permease family protein [Corynebacterium sp. HMSC078A10]OFK62149.1 ABC transporter permease [Corynebacterium sp. HMSC078A10]
MATKNTMRTVSVRNILAHKLRLALTLLAVVLGTAFISGSFMFTKSLSNTFDSAVSTAFTGVDAAVSQKEGGPILDQKMRDDIAADPDVRAVNMQSSQTVVVANKDAEAFQTGGGTSSVQPYYPEDQSVGEPATLVDGSAPHGTGEVLINDSAAEEFDIKIGDSLLVVHPDQRDEVKVVGVVKPVVDQGPSLTLLMDHEAFVERYGNSEQLKVAAAEGVSADELVDHLNETFEVKAESGQKLADEISDQISSALKFVNYFLIAFGLIALLVGTFIIANTFSMIVAQRTKEFALLRALGASRGQITRSVVTEAFIVGLVGSAVGVAAGMGLVAIIKAVFEAKGMPMGGGLGLSLSAVLVPLILGALVTIVSAWAPARRAGAVKPVEAMRTTESAAGASLLVRSVLGGLLLVVGIIFALVGVLVDASTGIRATLVGLGSLNLILGFFLAGPAISLPIVPAIGRVVGAPFGAVGKLASTNSARNPRRTAATAFALMLGVALVTSIGMLGATMKASVADAVEQDARADFLLSGPTSGNFPTPNETVQRARDTEGVGQLVAMSTAPLQVDGQASMNYGPEMMISQIIDGNADDMLNLTLVDGALNTGEEPGFIADSVLAEKQGWEVGQSYELAGPDPSRTAQVKLLGTYEPFQMLPGLAVSQSAAEEVIDPSSLDVTVVSVNAEEGYDKEKLRANLEKSVKDLVVVQVRTSEEYAGEAAGMIDQMLTILYALLALAVVIAVLGIVNTLTLGVIERRQEIGMLRAVGTQRRQIRTMITVESVQIALFGALMGILMGLGMGWSFISVLSDEGLDSATVPWMMLAVMFVGSGIVGVLAALWPAQRAAKTPPLDAIAD